MTEQQCIAWQPTSEKASVPGFKGALPPYRKEVGEPECKGGWYTCESMSKVWLRYHSFKGREPHFDLTNTKRTF